MEIWFWCLLSSLSLENPFFLIKKKKKDFKVQTQVGYTNLANQFEVREETGKCFS